MSFSYDSLYNTVTQALNTGIASATWLKEQGSQKISGIIKSLTPDQKELLERLFQAPLSNDSYDDYEEILAENENLKREFEQLKNSDAQVFTQISQITQRTLVDKSSPQKLTEALQQISTVADLEKAHILGEKAEKPTPSLKQLVDRAFSAVERAEEFHSQKELVLQTFDLVEKAHALEKEFLQAEIDTLRAQLAKLQDSDSMSASTDSEDESI
jgi:hypothetical protein